MAFSTRRGRPPVRTFATQTDIGTPELRLKHALGMTAEALDLCLVRALITKNQHWSGMHLRWLHTIRYGAPVLTSGYGDHQAAMPATEDRTQWREDREKEYNDSIVILKKNRYFEPVMQACVFNEIPAFLSPILCLRAKTDVALADQLAKKHHALRDGLDFLSRYWRGQTL